MTNIPNKIVALMLCLVLVLSVGSFATAEGEKVLKVHIETEVASLDPQEATDGTSFEVIADFTDGLYQMDASGMSVPALAGETTISEDGMTYTFKIRDDAFWSNGDPVTADDFVYGWQRAADPAFASEYAFLITDIGLMTVEGAEDDISGVGQTQAAHGLTPNLPAEKHETLVQPKVGHYGVFNGSRFRNEIYPAIRAFIRRNERG